MDEPVRRSHQAKRRVWYTKRQGYPINHLEGQRWPHPAKLDTDLTLLFHSGIETTSESMACVGKDTGLGPVWGAHITTTTFEPELFTQTLSSSREQPQPPAGVSSFDTIFSSRTKGWRKASNNDSRQSTTPTAAFLLQSPNGACTTRGLHTRLQSALALLV